MPHKVDSYPSTTVLNPESNASKAHNPSQGAQGQKTSKKAAPKVVVHNHKSPLYDEKRRSEYDGARWK